MRTINEIIIHCAATRPDQDFHAADIDRWHKRKGWDCIGYHFFIDLDGTIEPGRPIWKVGAHTLNHNKRSIGICYAGGVKRIGDTKLEMDTRTPAQVTAMWCLVSTLLHCFPTITSVKGHRDYNATSCPCFNAEAEFKVLVDKIRSIDYLKHTAKPGE